MAKQVINPLERHLEKAVIGLAALVLLGCVVRFLVASPNPMDLGGGKPVAPSEVDDVLAAKAAEISDRLRQATSQTIVPEPLAPAFEESLNPFSRLGLDQPLVLAAPLAPEVPIIDPPEVIVGGAKLVQVLQPDAPACTQGRSLIEESREGLSVVFGRSWVTCTTLFDRRRQEDLQADAYGNTRRQVVFGPIEMQRRAQRPDGSWSDDDWLVVPPFPPSVVERMGPVPRLRLDTDESPVVVPVEDLNLLSKFLEILREPRQQLDLLRPVLSGIIAGDPWLFPELVARKVLVLMDDEYLNPVETSKTPTDRYQLEAGGEAADAAPKEGQPVELTVSQRIQTLEEKLQRATNETECVEVYNGAFDLAHQTQAATAAEKARAQKLMQDANQKQRDLRRGPRPGQIPPGGRPPGDQPTQPTRDYQPQQQIWAIDAAEESVQPDTVCQYRMRVNLFNRLAGEPTKFDKPELALIIFVPGPWTEPSAPVVVPPVHEYFVTAADDRRGVVSVELFQWFEGWWVKGRDRFGVGEALARPMRAQIPDRFGGAGIDNAEVPFNAHAVVIDLALDVPFRERSRGATRDGVTYPVGGTSPAVVVVNEQGRLDLRFVASDKAHPEKKRYSDMVWQPPPGAK